jgi:hypothetical protein
LKHSEFANVLIVFMRSAFWVLIEMDWSHVTWYGSFVNTVMSSHWFLEEGIGCVELIT